MGYWESRMGVYTLGFLSAMGIYLLFGSLWFWLIGGL